MNIDRHTSATRSVTLLTLASLSLVLAGCGAEVAAGAAAVGGLQAQQLRQAQLQQTQIVGGLKAAEAAAAARTASAAD
jgi:hypothetical protein